MTITRGLVGGLLIASAMALGAMPAQAQAASFDIPASGVREALDSFARQSGIQLIYRVDQLKKRNSPGVRGTLTVEDALRELLSGTGLEARWYPSGLIAIVPAQPVARRPAVFSLGVERETSRQQVGTAGPEASDEPSEIIVTARRRDERLQDVPVAVTALEGAALEQMGVNEPLDLRQVVVGLSTNSAGGRTSTVIYGIRGQRQQDIQVAYEPAVQTYLDEALIAPLAGGNLGLFDLENVQVLKGPQGTLFGRNSTGGAILFTTAKPTDNLEGKVRLGFGNFDTWTGTAVLNLPVNDELRLRAAADFTKSDGWGRVVAAPGPVPGPSAGRRLHDRDDINLRLTAAFAPLDGVNNTLTGYYSRSKGGGTSHHIIGDINPRGLASVIFGAATVEAAKERTAALDPWDIESRRIARVHTRLWGLINTTQLDINDSLTLKNILSYRNTRWDEVSDYDGTILPLLDTNNFTRSKLFTEELQLQGKAAGGRLNYVAGVFYSKQDATDGSRDNVALGSVSAQVADVSNKSLAGFFQGTFALTDSLNVTAGVRYTKDWRAVSVISGNGPLNALTSCNFTDALNDPLPLNACVLGARKSFSKPTWTFSLDKKLADDTLVYIASRRGYRSGGFSIRANRNFALQTPFRPETVTDFEIGLKNTSPLGSGWSLRTNAATFYQIYKDIQRSVQQFSGGQLNNLVRNAAEAHIPGGEIEITLRHRSDLQLSASYSYVNFDYKKYDVLTSVGGVPAQPDDLSDRTAVSTPRHQFNLNAQASPDIGEIGELNLIVNLYYQSRIVWDETFQTRAHLLRALAPAAAETLPQDLNLGQKGYALVNLRAELNNISGSGFSVGAFANNVFDKRYIDAALITMPSFGTNFFTYGAPRTYGVEVSYKF